MVSARAKRKERWSSPSPYPPFSGSGSPSSTGAARPHKAQGEPAEPTVPAPPVELGDGGSGRSHGAVDAGEAAQRVVTHDRQLNVGLGQLLTHHRVTRLAVLLGQRHHAVELAPEAELEEIGR